MHDESRASHAMLTHRFAHGEGFLSAASSLDVKWILYV